MVCAWVSTFCLSLHDDPVHAVYFLLQSWNQSLLLGSLILLVKVVSNDLDLSTRCVGSYWSIFAFRPSPMTEQWNSSEKILGHLGEHRIAHPGVPLPQTVLLTYLQISGGNRSPLGPPEQVKSNWSWSACSCGTCRWSCCVSGEKVTWMGNLQSKFYPSRRMGHSGK